MLELEYNQQLPLPESLRKTVDLVLSRRQSIKGRGEEATKTAIIQPILSALGYDIHDLSEVSPEFDADFSIRKMGQKEKVDYCILVDNIPRIFMRSKLLELNWMVTKVNWRGIIMLLRPSSGNPD